MHRRIEARLRPADEQPAAVVDGDARPALAQGVQVEGVFQACFQAAPAIDAGHVRHGAALLVLVP